MDKRKEESVREYLERIPSFARKKSTRTEVREFLNMMGNPDRKFRIFHVAGTNGKGSVCAFLTAVLLEAGKSCGTFISPHLTDVRERFLINGTMVSEEDFQEAFEAVAGYTMQWEQAGHAHPTYFEYLFYMGMWLFSRKRTEFLVLETGMGGLLDVTNVIEEPLVSVITSISIDHTAFLGDTVEKIAAHKAGIIKKHRPAVYDGTSCGAAAVIEEKGRMEEAPVFPVKACPLGTDGEKIRIVCCYRGKDEEFLLPFSAPYQAANGALAVRALEVSGLDLDASVIRNGLGKARWPARMEEVRSGVFLDGAHNEDGMRAFLEAACRIRDSRKPERILFLFAAAADKDYRGMLKLAGRKLEPSVWFLTRMDSARALSLEELRKTLEEVRNGDAEIRCLEPSPAALEALFSEKRPGDLAFIAGSLYLAGEIKKETDHDQF